MVYNPILYVAIMILWFVAPPGFLIICSVSGIVNVISLVASNCLFTYFGFCGIHYNSSVGSVNSRLHNVKSQYHYAYVKVPKQELLK